jgi:hypothetical protein
MFARIAATLSYDQVRPPPKLQPEARGSISALVKQCRAQLVPAAPTFALH